MVKVNPLITFLIDAVIVAALVVRRREMVELDTMRSRSLPLTSVSAFVGLVVVSMFAMSSSTASLSEVDTAVQANEQLVILEPEKWVGKPFPLANHLSPNVQMTEGKWLAVLYHHDCPSCQAALPKYAALAENQTRSLNPIGVLFIEVPPYGDGLRSTEGTVTHARLANNQEWFVQAPVEVQLDEGIVTGSSTDLPSIGDSQ